MLLMLHHAPFQNSRRMNYPPIKETIGEARYYNLNLVTTQTAQEKSRMLLSLLVQGMILSTAFQGELIFPMNTYHNHGSGIVETPSGDLLAVWFHGSGERQSDDVMLQGARKRNGEESWSAPFLMADTPHLPDCNPVLFIDQQEVLWLFWIVVQDNEWGGSLLKYRKSTNYDKDGAPIWDWQDVIHVRPLELEERFTRVLEEGMDTYAALLNGIPELKEKAVDLQGRSREKIHQRLGWMTRTAPILLDEQTLILGLYSDVFNCSLAAFTNDGGVNWRFSTPILDPDLTMLGNIQPAFAKRTNGEIVAFMRDNGLPKQLRTAVSKDGGMTWSSIEFAGIPNPGSSVDVEVLHSGTWVLICNDTIDGRHRLSVYSSDDEGRSWPHSRSIEETEEKGGSFSYPAVIQCKDERIHVSYSYTISGEAGSSIKHVAFTEAWITDK